MTAEAIHRRSPKESLKSFNGSVERRVYSSGNEKEASMPAMENLIGSIPNSGDSVAEVRKIRKSSRKK